MFLRQIRCFSWVFAVMFLSIQALGATAKQTPFSPAQKTEIKQVVHDYLLENPKILMEMARKLQAMQQDEMHAAAEAGIKKSMTELFNDPRSPVTGNTKGTISLVEFYDYQCKYCKAIEPNIQQLVQDNPDLRVIHKPVAFFGANSEYAANAALASMYQGKYELFNKALMQSIQALNPQVILQIAKQTGLNVEQLKKDIEKVKKQGILESDMSLANQIGVNATPAMVFANYQVGKTNSDNLKTYFMLGLAETQQMQDVINKLK